MTSGCFMASGRGLAFDAVMMVKVESVASGYWSEENCKDLGVEVSTIQGMQALSLAMSHVCETNYTRQL